MILLRFIGFILVPLFTPVFIVVLGLAWIAMYSGMGIYQTWLRAKRDPRYNEYWWVGD